MHDKNLHATTSSKGNNKSKPYPREHQIKTTMDVESREMKPTVNILNVVNIKHAH